MKRVRAVAALPHGRAVVGVDDGRLLAIAFDATTVRLEAEVPALDAKSYVCDLAVSADASEVLSITSLRHEGITVLNEGWTGHALRWRLPDLAPLPRGPEYSAVPEALGLLPDGRALVGFRNQTVLGFARGERTWSFRLEGADAEFAALYAYLMSDDDRAAHGAPIRDLVTLPGGFVLTVASAELEGEGDLRVWDASGRELQRLFVGEELRPCSIAVSPDHSRVLVGFVGGRVDLFTLERRPAREGLMKRP